MPCYDASYDPTTGRSHCLLLDVSETHAVTVPRDRAMALDRVPSEAHLAAMVDALAGVQMPAEDLVFMFATFWTRAQRREGDREMRLIERYRARLAEHGASYGLDRLLDDYRVCIVYQLFRTIGDQTCGAGDGYWRPKLDCVIASFQNHGCADLFA